jgi:hypothetical protein
MNAFDDPDDPGELPEFAAIPPRSQLYSLEPMGVGTGMVESLTSYVARLAEAHSLKLSTFVGKILAPLGKMRGITGVGGWYDILRHLGASLNGTGGTSADCVAILESLTLQESLLNLTLRFTTGWLSDRALISTNQRWCPQCLNEWKRCGATVYYPLLWQLQVVQSCPVHQTLLESHCPGCGTRHRPLGKHLIPGHCPSCGGWLGVDGGMIKEGRGDDDVRQTQEFIANQCQTLIGGAATLESRKCTAWSKNIECLVRQCTRGTAHGLSQDLGIDHDTIKCWITTQHVPTLPSGLMVACAFDLNLIDLLSLPLAGEVRLVRSLKAAEVASLFRRRLKRHDAKTIEGILTEAAEHPADRPLSLMAVCKRAGCHQTFAARKFPELAQKIIVHKQMYVQIHKQQRQYFAGLITKSVASHLAASGQYPSHRRMSRALPSWISLREAVAKKAWLEFLEEWGWKRGTNESVN